MLEGDCRQEKYLSSAVTITGNVEYQTLSSKELRCCSFASCFSRLGSLCPGLVARVLLCASAPDYINCPTCEPAEPLPSCHSLASALLFPLFFALLLPQESAWPLTLLTSLSPPPQSCASAPSFDRSFHRPSPPHAVRASTLVSRFPAAWRSAPLPLAPLPSPRSPLRFFLHFSECHTLRRPGRTTVSPRSADEILLTHRSHQPRPNRQPSTPPALPLHITSSNTDPPRLRRHAQHRHHHLAHQGRLAAEREVRPGLDGALFGVESVQAPC